MFLTLGQYVSGMPYAFNTESFVIDGGGSMMLTLRLKQLMPTKSVSNGTKFSMLTYTSPRINSELEINSEHLIVSQFVVQHLHYTINVKSYN